MAGDLLTHRDDELLPIPNTHVRIAAKVECINSKDLRGSVQVLICGGHENRSAEFDGSKARVPIWEYYSATYTPLSAGSRVRNAVVTYDRQCSQPVRTPQPRWGGPTDRTRDAATTLLKNLQHLHRLRPRGALLSRHGNYCRRSGPFATAGDAAAAYRRVGLPSPLKPLKRTIGLTRGRIEQHQLEVCETWAGR